MVTAELGACEWFVYELRRSNLIDRGQLDQVVGEFLKSNPRAEPPGLASYLVEQSVLSAFQAERVLTNKAAGLVLGPYVLVDSIGSGSMGTVYKAVSKNDNKQYAVKVLPRRSMWNVRLARRQVRSFSQIKHPAVVPFVDVGTSGGMHYLVWPLVEGETLEALVQRLGKLPAEQTAQVGLQIAAGLNVCHQQGIFHGMLKPSNVMIGADNQISLLDFGIGSLLAENEGESLVDTMSTANALTSGLDCASPESIMEPTNRTPAGDQYSLGCTLYYCLTGRYPFPEGSAVEKMMAHQFKEPTPIRELAEGVPDKLVEVIEMLTKKKPEERFGGADEVVDELRPLAGAVPAAVTAAPPKNDVKAAFSMLRERTVRKANAAHVTDNAAPPSTPIPAPASPYPAPATAGPAAPPRSNPGLLAATSEPASSPPPPMPTRRPVKKESSTEAGSVRPYTMPPGYVEDSAQPSQSPVFYMTLGMGVMAVAYMLIMLIRPF